MRRLSRSITDANSARLLHPGFVAMARRCNHSQFGSRGYNLEQLKSGTDDGAAAAKALAVAAGEPKSPYPTIQETSRRGRIEPSLLDLDIEIPAITTEEFDAIVKRNQELEEQEIELEEKLDRCKEALGGLGGKNSTSSTTSSSSSAATAQTRPKASVHFKREQYSRSLVGEDIVEGDGTQGSDGGSTTNASRKPAEGGREPDLPTDREGLRNEIIKYETEKMKMEEQTLIIDLRTLSEIESWGTIPTAKVIPEHMFFDALHLSADDFFLSFGFSKPRADERMIFYCQYGPRSLMAAQIASWLGYTKCVHYREGYFEWTKREYVAPRMFRKIDIKHDFEQKSAEGFAIARALGRDVAPELNKLVEGEVDEMKQIVASAKRIQPTPVSKRDLGSGDVIGGSIAPKVDPPKIDFGSERRKSLPEPHSQSGSNAQDLLS